MCRLDTQEAVASMSLALRREVQVREDNLGVMAQESSGLHGMEGMSVRRKGDGEKQAHARQRRHLCHFQERESRQRWQSGRRGRHATLEAMEQWCHLPLPPG